MHATKKNSILCILLVLVFISFTSININASEKAEIGGFFEADIRKILSSMSIEEKIGQILIFGFKEEDLDDDYRSWLSSGRVGNIKIFLRNVESREQLKKLTILIKYHTNLSKLGIPPFIATDMEGGLVNHIRYDDLPLAPSAALIGASYNCTNSILASRLIALTLREAGINMNFAPCIDVLTNPENRVISTRAYSSDPLEVYFMARAFIREHERLGLMAVAKHFPGHGMTDFDTHTSSLSVAIDKEELEEIHLFPYKYLIKENLLGGCMVSHVIYSDLDSFYPASLSRKIVSGLLREKLGFDGVIITDDLEMDASEDFTGDIVKSFILSFRSGADLILVSHTKEKQQKLLERAPQLFEKGILSEELLNQKVLRILKAKQRYLSRFYNSHVNEDEDQTLAASTSRELQTAAKEGIVQISSILDMPFVDNLNEYLGSEFKGVFLAPSSRFVELADEYLDAWDIIYIRYRPGKRENERKMQMHREKLKNYDFVMIGMVNQRQAEWAQLCVDEEIPFGILSMQNPFFALPFTDDAHFIATCFSPYSPEVEALFECVFHTGEFGGTFPYQQ
ncbi:MAG: glycoside hydrolase family 3 protein [Spirochaetota bacterium]|nr:MAG: glycoside hydrolase family 3 protein [Spirochaetota bacterium]